MQQVNPDMSEKDINLLFNTLDLDGNNSISFMEFMAATVDPREVDIQEMNQVSFARGMPIKEIVLMFI